MVYQDRIETTLLQLFVQHENSEWLSIISVVIFKVNIVAEQEQKCCSFCYSCCYFVAFATRFQIKQIN